MVYWFILLNHAEPAVAADRAGIRALCSSMPSPPTLLLSSVDYEAVGKSSRLGYIFSFFSRQQRRWLSGGPGGGNERPWSPHGRGEIFSTDAWPTAAATQRLGDALDYSSCGTPRANLWERKGDIIDFGRVRRENQ